MAFKENTTTSEKAATLIEETENINAELAEIDRQLAEMENSPDKPEGLSRISHAGKNDNIGIFGIFDPMVQKQEKLLPEFPIECFPDVIKDYTKGIADTLQVPVDMEATMVLDTMALCVQGKFQIDIKPGWVEPLNLYTVAIGRPSERKSPALKEATQPVYDYMQEENERRLPQIKEYGLKKKIIQGRLKTVQDNLSKKDNPTCTLQDALICQQDLEVLEKEEVKPVQLIVDDITPEALARVMKDNNERMAIISAEGGVFGIMAGRYSQFPNIDIFLKAFSGESYSSVRVGRESVEMRKPLLTLGLAVQPKVIADIMDNEDFRGRGLLARFLYCMPNTKIGKRTYRLNTINIKLKKEYENLCKELLGIPDLDGFIERTIKLSDEADKLAEDFFYWIEERLVSELEVIEDWAGKLHGNTMRIAGILHVVKHRLNSVNVPLEEETMKSAITIGKYYLEHSKAAFDIMGLMETKDVKDAKYIVSRLIPNTKNTNNTKNEITKRDLWQLCKGHFSSVAEMEPGIQCLVEHGYIAIVKESQGKGRPSERIYVNPEYYKWKDSNKLLSKQ